MDVTKLSDADLRALSENRYDLISERGLRTIAGVERPPEKGLFSSVIGGAKQLGSALQTTGEALTGSAEEAARRGIERGEEIARAHAPGASLEAVKKAYAERGLLPAAGEAISQIPTAFAEQFPNIAASLASARAGAMAGSRFGPQGALIGGVGGAALPAAGQLFGSALERQAQEEVPEISRAKAAAAAIPGAALEVASTFIPLGRSLVGKILGPDVEKALAKGTNEAIERVANESLKTTLAKGAGVGVLAEGSTEVIQQMLERAQAGLPLTTPDALAEYGKSAYGAGLVGGPFGALGRVGQRSVARSEKQAKEEAERFRLAEEERKKVEAEEQAAIARRAGAPLLTAEEATMGAEFSAYDAEGKLKAKEQLTEEAQSEYQKLYTREVQLQDSIKKARDEGRTKDLASLNTERRQINNLRNQLEQRVKNKKDELFGIELKEPTLVEESDIEGMLQSDIDAVKKRLDKAIDLGDFEKVDKLTQEYEDLKKKAREYRAQPDLFGTQYQTRLEEEVKERKAAEEEMQRKQQEAVDVVTLTNLLNLAEQKREARAERRKTEEDRAIEIEQERALKRLEFNIDRRGLTALGVAPDDMATVEADTAKGVVSPNIAQKLDLFAEELAIAKRKVAEAEDKAKKDEYKAELAALQAKIAQPQRAADIMDTVDRAWEKATAKQRAIALDLAAGKIDLFDAQGKLTKQGAEAVKNQVAVEQLTKLRNAGREARGVIEQQKTEEQQAAEAEAILSGAKPFGQSVAQATKVLPQQRLSRMRDRFEGQIAGINDQIRYLQSLPTVEVPGEPSFEKQIQDLELERREFEAALSRVKRELGDEVEATRLTETNNVLSDFSDAIYKLQRGEFFGKRPTEVTKTGELTRVGQAEAERNKELQDKIDRLQVKLDGVKRRLLDPDLRNVDTRNALARDQSKLEGEIKTLSAGLSKKSISKQQLIEQTIQKIEKERGEKLSSGEKRSVVERLEKELSPQSVGGKTFQQLVSAAEKARDSYIDAAVNQVNGTRAARGLTILQPDAEQKFRQSLASSFNEFIQRASRAQRVKTEALPKEVTRRSKTAVGAALEEAGITGTRKPPKAKIPPEFTPFAKIREALDVLRETLDETVARARGDVAAPEPKFELKDYLEVLLGRAAQRPARRIKGQSKIEEIADSIQRIDEKLEELQGVGAGPEFVDGLKEQIKLLTEKPQQLQQLLKLVKQSTPEELELLEDDPVIGAYIKNPEKLQTLYDEARRELPKMKQLLAEEEAKLKTKKSLEKLKAAKESQRDALIDAADKARGVSELVLKQNEVRDIQYELLTQQREFQDLGVKLFDWGRIAKVTLPAKAKRLETEIAQLTKLAKTDRNPQFRQDKIKRLKAELTQVKADIATTLKQIAVAKSTRKILEGANKALIKNLRALGVEATANTQGEYILTQIEDAQTIKKAVEKNILLEEIPKLREARDKLENAIAALTKQNNIITRRIKLFVPAERKEKEKTILNNKKIINANKSELATLDKKIAQIVGRGGVEETAREGQFTVGQIEMAKKALLKRIEQTQERLKKQPKIETKTMEDVLERAKIGAIEGIGVTDKSGKRVAGRTVTFEEGRLEYKLSEEEIEQKTRERNALYDPQLKALRAEFEERKAELAKAKESPAVKAALAAYEKARDAVKTQKNEADGVRLAGLAAKAKDNYDKVLTESLSFPIEDIRKYPAKIAGLTRLKNFVATVRYVPTKVSTTTELFVNNNKIEKEAERQRFEASLRKETKKPLLQAAENLLGEATDALKEAKDELIEAEAKGNRALITAAKAQYLRYQRAYTTVLMKYETIRSNLQKQLTTKTASDAAVNASLALDETLSSEEKAKIKEAADSYNMNRDTAFAFGDEVTDVIDMDAATKRMEDVAAKAAARGIKVKYFGSFDTMSAEDLKPIADELIRQGKDIFADRMQGGVQPDGTVFVFIGHHNNLADLEKTIAHEIIGHYTVDSMLGVEGLVKLLRRIEKSFGSLQALADKLGVGNEVQNTYIDLMNMREHKVRDGSLSAAEQDEFAKIGALRELIAYTTEKRIPKGIAATAKQFLQELIGAVRQFLRDIGLLDASKLSTEEIYKLIRSAKDRFEEGKPIAYRTIGNYVALRGGQTAKWAGGVSPSIINTVNKVIAKTPTAWEKLRANMMGLNFRTQFVDSIDSLERIKKLGVAKGLLDAVQAVDLTYFYRMYNQRMSFVSEAATNGVVQLTPKKRADGKLEYTLDRDLQKDAASLKKVVLALANAGFGDAKANGDFFTLYMAAERALNVGKEKLDYTDTLTDKELEEVRKVGRSNAAIQEARRTYNRYNKDLITLLVQAGAISKETAAKLLANSDYIPYYRQTKDGLVNLYIEGEKILKIGSITEQPHLKELVGGRLDDDAKKSQPIEDFFTSSLQNTNMIMDLALRNLATRNTAFVLQGLGLAKRVSSTMTGTRVIRAKLDGEDAAWEISTEGSEVFGDIPAEIIVKGLDGIKTVLPEAMRIAAVPADFFRKLVTRDPRYAVRQVFRDSMAAYMATGSDAKPVVDTTSEIIKIFEKGGSETQRTLGARGITGGQVITGNIEDMSKILAQMTGGKTGWEAAMAKLDAFAMAGDAATRVSAYNSFLRQGLSEREATLATLETMNFSRRGVSPSVTYLNSLIPFFSANLQGLDVLYRAFKGDMPESQRLKVQQKLVARGAMMAALTVVYAAMMDDDEAYKNANPLDRYSNWFVKIPGIKEPFKVPIPFELGWIFKALPEGLVRAATGKEKGSQVMADLAKMLARSVPGDIPLVMKPAIEVMADYSFFTGNSVVSARLAGMDKEFQYTSNTPEMIKHLGAALSFRIGDKQYGLSPAQIEHFVRGYTGGLPLALLGMTDPVFRGFTAPTAVRPDMRITDVPVLGGLFQPVDAGGLIERAYETARAAERVNKTYKDLVATGKIEEAKEYRADNIELLSIVSTSGKLTKQVGELSKQMRLIESLPETRMSGERKRELLDKLRSQQIRLAEGYLQVRDKIESRFAQ